MADGVCVCVCGQWILRCKCRIVNWKYVKLGDRGIWNARYSVCMVRGYWYVNVETLLENM